MYAITRQLTYFYNHYRDELMIFFGVLFLGFSFAFYVFASGLTTVFVDQGSHLNIARQIFDSMTPGISQVGFWPPLLHILMAPFAQIDVLYGTGLAGAAVLLPLLALASVYLYQLLNRLTSNRYAALLGVFLFVSNPYVLYYSVVPMTEMLFVSLLIITAYYLVTWLETRSFNTFVVLGLLVAMTSLSRFEGFFAVIIVGGIVVAKLVLEKRRYAEIEGTAILFWSLAGLGILFTLVYGMVYAGDPLVFMTGPWSASTQQQFVFVPTDGSAGFSLLYLTESAKLLLGNTLVIVSFASLIASLVLLFRDERYVVFLSLSLFLLGPFLFDLLALFQGSAVVYLDHLPPFNGYFNERYGLYLAPFVVVSTVTFLALLAGKHQQSSFLFIRRSAALLFVGIVFGASLQFTSQTIFVGNSLSVVRESSSAIRFDQIAAAKAFNDEYDGGKILLTRAVQNFFTLHAEVPLKDYIHESNFQYYDLALERPWLYARWVVTYNPKALQYDPWRRENEKISAQWIGNHLFDELYELVYENDTNRVYRLNDARLRLLLGEFAIDTHYIPSLNPDLKTWNPTMAEDYLANHFSDTLKTYQTTYERVATILEVIPPTKNL